MSRVRDIGLLLLAVLAASAALPVAAQENVEAGKTPAQLYATDCAICHKSPRGLSKAGGMFGLSSFLRKHYTASRETAAVIAKYLESVDQPASPAKRKRAVSSRKKGDKPGGDKDKSATQGG
ncbi:MAG TPA: cytochrome C [Pseudolabrys sp.]|jgi:mono/diheme cytochrome c family protein|nr:cytochrome C [Pseudolabrys sp.]